MKYSSQQDSNWIEVVGFLRKENANPAKTIAPQKLGGLLSGIIPYESKNLYRNEKVEWIVVHKGMMEELGCEWLIEVIGNYTPVIANEVFILFAKSGEVQEIKKSNHYISFLRRLKDILPSSVIEHECVTNHIPIYLGHGRALMRTIHGHKMYVDTNDHSLSPHLLLDGVWEQWVTKIFLDVVQMEAKVIDIGANVGYYSLLAARAIGAQGTLWCFEANPQMVNILFANLEINGYLDRAQVIGKAVFKESAKLEFYIYNNHLGSSSLYSNKLTAEPFHDKTEKIVVDAVTLDEFFEPGTKIDLIKIDAEGAEPHILEGAQRIIFENPEIKIILEFIPLMLNITCGSAEIFFNKLVEMGFEIYRIEEDSTLRKASYEYLDRKQHSDIFLQRSRLPNIPAE